MDSAIAIRMIGQAGLPTGLAARLFRHAQLVADRALHHATRRRSSVQRRAPCCPGQRRGIASSAIGHNLGYEAEILRCERSRVRYVADLEIYHHRVRGYGRRAVRKGAATCIGLLRAA